MKFNKDVQYAILFCLYLARSGRANSHTAAANLGLSKQFLDQVARKLRISGVINSLKGPGGGFELNEDSSFYDILATFRAHKTILDSEAVRFKSSPNTDHRALEGLFERIDISVATNKLLNMTPKQWSNSFVMGELTMLNALNLDSIQN